MKVPVEDFSSMPAAEMFARRDAARSEIARLIGQLVFDYSRFVTALHLCVGWHGGGKDLDTYPSIAGDLVVADILKKIEKQVRSELGPGSDGGKMYKAWLRRAHKLRETRNVIMHSRWGIDAFGRHAIAITTPVFVEPPNEVVFTVEDLRKSCQDCEMLSAELSKLREEYPL